MIPFISATASFDSLEGCEAAAASTAASEDKPTSGCEAAEAAGMLGIVRAPP